MARFFASTGSGMLALSLILSACGPDSGSKTAAEQPSIPVEVTTVRTAPEAADVLAYGLVKPDREAVLSFKIAGLLKTLAVDTGDKVKKGQLLAELDQREIDAQAINARAAAEKARRDLARIEPLLPKGFVSVQRAEDARTALAQARAALTQVEFNRSLARITAPNDGTVLARHVEKNEIIPAGTPVLTVSQGTQGFILKAGLSDRDVARIALGSKARIILDAFPDRTITGEVRRIAGESNPQTGTFDVEITLNDVPQGVGSGFIASASIAPRDLSGPAYVAIPASAILEGHGTTANVYVIDAASKTAQQTRITVARIEGDDVLVTQGLSAGMQVVSAGAPYLREGAKVTIVQDLEKSAPQKEPRT